MKPVRFVLAAALSTGLALPARSEPIDSSSWELVDLTHAFNAQTLYWPTSPTSFELDTLSYGETPGGWFYSAHTISTPEHGGTHMDAPIHFHAGGETADQVPLERLVARGVVLDVSAAAARNPDYRLAVADVEAFERAHGTIGAGTIVLLRTGWDRRWPDRKAYFGDDTPHDATHLHFPSFGAEAARLLVEERKVAAIGVDTPSIDYGPSQDFAVHRIASARGVPGFENLASLERVPATGALVVALPMKIEGGSGGPLRAIALVPRSGR